MLEVGVGRIETAGDLEREEIRDHARWLGGDHLETFPPHSLYLARDSTLA